MTTNKSTIIAIVIAMTIVVLGIGAGLIFGVRYYVLGACETTSTNLNDLLVSVLERNISAPKVIFYVSTDFPSVFLIDTTVQTQYGPVAIYDNITIDLPKTVGIPIGPYAITIEDLIDQTLGDDAILSFLSSTKIIGDVCSSYLTSAIYIIGASFTIFLAWLAALSLVLGLKIQEYDETIKND